MSLHSSLKVDSASAKQRTVLTRIERIKDLMKKGLWQDNSKVTALPKVKIIKIKAKAKVKEEAAAVPGAEGAAAAPAAEAAAPKEAKKEVKKEAKK